MLNRELIEQQIPHTLGSVSLPELGQKYEGKVRDCYVLGDQRVFITSDRLSAFDRVLTTIPFKGQLLNEMAAHWFSKTAHIVQNHLIDQPHPNVFVTREVQILPVEVIVRGYLTGSAWRDYQAGNDVSGISLPQGLSKSERFATPLITPSTKAEQGAHDEPISSEQIVSSGIVEKKLWEEICETALGLFACGTEEAAEQGLILVDTKYEFGLLDGKTLVLADEIHTSDSSRYWMNDSYSERFNAGQDPHMLDKEFVRRWLIEQGYMGDGTPPDFTDAFRVDTAMRYMEAFEKITGSDFSAEVGSAEGAIEKALTPLFS